MGVSCYLKCESWSRFLYFTATLEIVSIGALEKHEIVLRLMKKILVSMFFLAFFTTVGVVSGEDKSSGNSEGTSVSELSDLVEQRFQKRWQALIDRDFETAYGLESQAYRDSVDLPGYVNSYHPDLVWNSVKVDKINIETKTKAVVSYRLSFTFKTDWDMVLENTDFHDEEWFFENGEWWHDKKAPVSPYSVLNQE